MCCSTNRKKTKKTSNRWLVRSMQQDCGVRKKCRGSAGSSGSAGRSKLAKLRSSSWGSLRLSELHRMLSRDSFRVQKPLWGLTCPAKILVRSNQPLQFGLFDIWRSVAPHCKLVLLYCWFFYMYKAHSIYTFLSHPRWKTHTKNHWSEKWNNENTTQKAVSLNLFPCL